MMCLILCTYWPSGKKHIYEAREMLQIPFIIMDRLDEFTVFKIVYVLSFLKDPFEIAIFFYQIKGNKVFNVASNIHGFTDVTLILYV